ncbi:UNVERIFIED_CONTAM: hypothetical protein GTU68_053121 [Idotea baltica]|nr:hypothetical protein [Idotea baltica]
MKVVLQRVSSATVSVSSEIISRIESGFLILLGIEDADTRDDLIWLVAKIARMRVFDDADGKMNHSLIDTGGEALVVSQFTLHASTRKGNRPSFTRAARPDHAEPLYEEFCLALSNELGKPVGKGRFGAMMEIQLLNNGPVTIVIDSQLRE